MSEESKFGVKLLWQYGLLMLILAAFNFYWYYHNGSKLSLAVGAACVLGFVGWNVFYYYYVRRR